MLYAWFSFIYKFLYALKIHFALEKTQVCLRLRAGVVYCLLKTVHNPYVWQTTKKDLNCEFRPHSFLSGVCMMCLFAYFTFGFLCIQKKLFTLSYYIIIGKGPTIVTFTGLFILSCSQITFFWIKRSLLEGQRLSRRDMKGYLLQK